MSGIVIPQKYARKLLLVAMRSIEAERAETQSTPWGPR